MSTRHRSGIIFLVLFFAFAGAAFGAYPEPVGFVNDFANILSAEVRKNLEQTLREYKQKTSIDIAVVTTLSLEGNTVEEYTIGLARAWGIGNKKKDNGVVLLVAPNERKVRIEVGYGMEPDLTDGQAGAIVQDSILPYFKKKQMTEGIVVGVVGIIRTLGDKPFAERLAEREAQKEQDRIAHEQTVRAFKTFGTIAGLVAVFAAFIGIVWYTIARAIRNRKELKALYTKNTSRLAECAETLQSLRVHYSGVSATLESLKKGNPKEVWQELSRQFETLLVNFESDKKALMSIRKTHEEGGWHIAREVHEKITAFSSALDAYAVLYEKVRVLSVAVKRARQKTLELLASFPATLERARKAVAHEDVTEGTKQLVTRAAAGSQDAQAQVGAASVNWLAVAAVLAEAAALLQKAEDGAASDRAAAVRARKEGPELLRKFPEALKKAEKAVSDSDVLDETKKKVKDAKKKYQTAASRSSGGPVDWLLVYLLLTAANSLLQNAVQAAKDDIEDAERARRRRRSSSSSSSWSSSSSLSYGGSSGGGGFGGFGGGSFGGGGASGSW